MPLKPRCRELVGLRARTTHRLETRFVGFGIGTEMEILGTYRGTFTLKPIGLEVQWPPLHILKAPRWSFDLIDKPKPRLTPHELRVLIELNEPNKNPDNWWHVPVRWVRACEALVEVELAKSHAEREGERVFSITRAGITLLNQELT